VPSLPAHLPALDGLRGLAVLLVVLHNLRRITEPPGDLASLLWVQLLDRGWIGVQLFFVLSGFLITRILLRTREAENYYSGFFARRILRIFPLYYATLIVCLLLWPTSHDTSTDPYLWVFLSNWVQPFHRNAALNHFWSLAVEEQFYLLWPFAIRYFRPLPFCLTIAAWSLLTRVAMLAANLPTDAVYLWTPCRIDALALGGAVAVLAERQQMVPRYLPWITLLAGAALSRGYRQTGALAQTAGYSLLAAGFALWILSILGEPEAVSNRFLRWRWLQSFGRYSYGIYVIHLPFVPVAEWALAQLHPGRWTLVQDVYYVLVTLAVVYALAFLSYHLFESRFLRLKSHFEPRWPRP
jgi:peptidoglycan/LPS O-acetylase OafA/YrhL